MFIDSCYNIGYIRNIWHNCHAESLHCVLQSKTDFEGVELKISCIRRNTFVDNSEAQKGLTVQGGHQFSMCERRVTVDI